MESGETGLSGDVRIRKRGAARIRNGHLWVYRSDVLDAEATPRRAPSSPFETSAMVWWVKRSTVRPVADCAAISLHAHSEMHPQIDEASFVGDLKKPTPSDTALASIPAEPPDLIPKATCLPGLIVDRYGEYLVVQSLTQAADRLQPLFTTILQERYQPRSIIFRNDSKVRELEGLPITQDLVRRTTARNRRRRTKTAKRWKSPDDRTEDRRLSRPARQPSRGAPLCSRPGTRRVLLWRRLCGTSGRCLRQRRGRRYFERRSPSGRSQCRPQ